MSKKIRIALIGCGGMGNHHLIGYTGENAGKFEIAALCDIEKNKAETAKSHYGLDLSLIHIYVDHSV